MIPAIIEQKDFDKMYALRHKILREPLGLNLFTQDFSCEKDYIKIGVFHQKNLVACAMLEMLENQTVKLRQMAVDKALQGNGIGTLLMEFAQQYCMQNNIKTIVLSARISARNFYIKLGYLEIGKQYIEINLPHILMQKQL
jgi:predicted GNAT family N-acyltransferase